MSALTASCHPVILHGMPSLIRDYSPPLISPVQALEKRQQGFFLFGCQAQPPQLGVGIGVGVATRS